MDNIEVGDLVAHHDPHIYIDEPQGERSLGIVLEISRKTGGVKVHWPRWPATYYYDPEDLRKI